MSDAHQSAPNRKERCDMWKLWLRLFPPLLLEELRDLEIIAARRRRTPQTVEVKPKA